jgi:hypothetical protein
LCPSTQRRGHVQRHDHARVVAIRPRAFIGVWSDRFCPCQSVARVAHTETARVGWIGVADGIGPVPRYETA